MTVYLVGAGPGDPGLLTRRGAQLLARADVVLHDRLVSGAVLDLAPPDAVMVDVGKEPDAAGADRQDEIARLLVQYGRSDGVVVRLKGGDPFVFGRGGEEVEVLRDAGIDWEVVPGVTSAFGVPAVAGIPVTQRGLASSVTVVTGRVGDALGSPGAVDWEALARAGGTLVVLMGVTTRAAIADELVAGGRDPGTPVAVIERGTGPAERVVRTTLGQLGSVQVDAPAVIVVGPVAALGRARPERGAPGGASTPAGAAHRDPGPPAGGSHRRGDPLGTAGRAPGRSALERAGASVVTLPLTRQVDADDGGAALRAAAATVGDYAWLVVTSVNAVDRFVAELRDARALAPVRVAALGPATADAFRMAGIEPDLVPAEHSARGLVEVFPETDPGAGCRRVLFPCADIAPDTIADGLADERLVGGSGHGLPDGPRQDARARGAGAGVGGRRRGVHRDLFGARLQGAPRVPTVLPSAAPGHVVCIGPTTAEAARAAGFSGVHEAWGASTEGILAELVDHFGPADGTP